MVKATSQAERLAAIRATIPGVFLATDLPERPARSSGGTAESAPRITPGCVSDGVVDTQDLGDNQRTRGQPGAL